jgi:hypothetical protein
VKSSTDKVDPCSGTRGGDPPYGADMSKISLLSELFEFLKERKKWWLIPIVVILLLLGILMIIAETSALAPFIYTLF